MAAQGAGAGVDVGSASPILFTALWTQVPVGVFINRAALIAKFSGIDILKEEIFLKEKS